MMFSLSLLPPCVVYPRYSYNADLDKYVPVRVNFCFTSIVLRGIAERGSPCVRSEQAHLWQEASCSKARRAHKGMSFSLAGVGFIEGQTLLYCL